MPGIGPLPTLPPTVALSPAETLSTQTEQTSPTSSTLSPTLTRLLLPTEPDQTEVAQTEEAASVLAMVQTQFALTLAATLTPCSESRCFTPTPTRTPRSTSTSLPTSTPSPVPAYLSIKSPGPLSRITSPFFLDASAHTGANGAVRIELLGEDGRLLLREIARIGSEAGMPFKLTRNLTFEIPSVSEAARLQISIDDDYNRPIALSSVDVILLTQGEMDIYPPGDGLDTFMILSPYTNEEIDSGIVHVRGKIRPFNASPIFFELFTQEGALVGARQLSLSPLPDGSFIPYQIDIPYSVTISRSVRLIIRQQGGRIPGDLAISSRVIRLNPGPTPTPSPTAGD